MDDMTYKKFLKSAAFGLTIIGLSSISGFFAGAYINGQSGFETLRNAPSVTIADNGSDGGYKYSAARAPVRTLRSNKSGDFLIALTAQKRHDWQTASEYFAKLLKADPDNPILRRRAVTLFLGSDNIEKAADIAKGFQNSKHNDDMAKLVLALNAVKANQFQNAKNILTTMSEGQETRIVKPLVQAWIEAGLGNLEVSELVKNPLYIYDAVIIASYLNDKTAAKSLVGAALKQNGIVSYDLERIGDLFARQNLTEEAKTLYKAALGQKPKDQLRLTSKLEALKNNRSIKEALLIAKPPETAITGLSQSIFDISMILFRQGADSLSRLYASMALALNPEFSDARLLTAHIMAFEGHLDAALKQYKSISAESEAYLKAQRRAADILEEAGQEDKAIALLKTLVDERKDIESRIQIGDIYRRQERFEDALTTYNTALEQVELDYEGLWNLYYKRGMAHERLKNHKKSERDLRAALERQPDNPYILNYLGYSMADHGRNLDESLDMIRKAVKLRPDDGFITDSLGWALYQLGRYEKAVPHLERAVELVPYDSVINDHLGDAYWKIGREVEARFQWSRARNHSDDQHLIADIEQKMQHGLEGAQAIQAARHSSELSNSELSGGD